jgi:uncharacterized protein (TIGR04255 family)
MTQYRNPPIVEAVCELRFSSQTKWPSELVDQFYNAIRETFPERDRIIDHQLKVQITPDKARSKTEKNERAVFLTKDRRMFIQFGERVVSIHRLKPYPSWENFRPVIEQVYTVLSELTQIAGIDRVGLLYVDKIEIPGTEISLKEYFRFRPVFEELDQPLFVNFLVGVDLPYEGERDLCRLQLTRTIAEQQGHSAFLLTTDYFLRKRQGIPPNDVPAWLKGAHDEIKVLFKTCITKKLEKIFQGEV